MNLKRPVDLKGLLQLIFAGLMIIALSVLLGPVLNQNAFLRSKFLNPGFALYAAGFAVFFFSLIITAFFLFARLISLIRGKLKTSQERKI